MKQAKTVLLTSTLAILAATPVLAQNNKGHEQKEKEKGAIAHAARQEKDQLELPTFVKASIGASATLENEDGQVPGVVRNQVVDRTTGRVLEFAIGDAKTDTGKVRLVPFARLKWDAKTKRLALPSTKEEFDALPEIEANKIVSMGPRGAEEGREEHANDKAKDPAPMQRHALLASEILASKVMAARQPVASVSELVLEPKDGTIAFVLANAEGAKADPYVIPWRAMNWEADDTGAGHFAVTISKDEFARAPKLAQDELTNLSKPGAVDGIYGFYKVSPYAVHQ